MQDGQFEGVCFTNGYFRLVKAPGGFGIRFFPPREGGEGIRISDVLDYLNRFGVDYDANQIKKYIAEKTDAVCFLGRGDCPVCDESYLLEIGDDQMEAVARFYPPSETGRRITFEEFFRDLRYRNIVSGVQMSVLQDHFQSGGIYCTDLVVARGKEPRHGYDAKIKYHFNTDVHVKPTMREDGSVDFFHLNVINHCRKGELLAEIIPEDPGEPGTNILGRRVAPRTVKRAVLKFGRNIELSPDKMSIYSKVNGHVVLVGDKVFVSDVYEVENVDISTGNIEFEGSVQVNGNVASNFVVRANGNVIINGVVEGAHIIAGGNIIIARGMNGMGKGTLEAAGDIVAKFIENATATAGGYVNTESILHSQVSAQTEITVTGKRGFITGGYVQAGNRITVKNLGSGLGASTVVEVGVSPEVKAKYVQLQKEVAETVKLIKSTQPILISYGEKKARGVRFTEEQLKYVKDAARLIESKREEVEEKSREMNELQSIIGMQRKAAVVVQGSAYPGTTIIIGDVSMMLQSNYQYCRFEKVEGDVKMLPM